MIRIVIEGVPHCDLLIIKTHVICELYHLMNYNTCMLNSASNTHLILTTNPGLEDIVTTELQLHLQRADLPAATCTLAPYGMAGAIDVRCATPRNELTAVVKTMRSIHHVHQPAGWIELTHPSGDPLRAIAAFLHEAEIPEMRAAKHFRVTGKRVGQHDFTSIDVQKAAGAALVEQYDCGVNLTQYDANILVNVYHDHCYIAAQLTDDPLDARYDYVYRPKVSLKSNVAYALLHLADLRPDNGVPAHQSQRDTPIDSVIDSVIEVEGEVPNESPNESQSAPVLLDPFCGSGTILLEAAACLPDYQILGSDRYENAVGWARDNVGINQYNDRISILQGDARDLRKIYEPNSIDIIVTNPPFGAQLGANANFQELYRHFLSAAWGVLKSGGRIAMLVWKRGAFNGVVKQFDYAIRHVRIVDMGGIFPGIFILEKEK